MVTLNGIYKKLWMVIILTLMLLSQFIVSAEINKDSMKADSQVDPSLQILKEKLKNVEIFGVAVDIVTEMYGEPNRNLGSFNPIPQWDIGGGFITCLSLSGVIYSKRSNFTLFDDDIVSLIDTVNRVDENLWGFFKMFALPQENSMWLGDLELKKEGQYLYNGGGKGVFFDYHPSGTYTIEYPKDVKPEDLLENKKSGAILAKIIFQAGDNHETYSLYFCTKGRGIVGKSTNNRNLPYEMASHWKNSYYKLTGPRTLPPFALFREQIKNADSSSVAYKIIRKIYGDAQRITDSSEGIWFEWDVDGGVLFFNLRNGVSYEKMGQRIYLINTQNKVEKTVIGYYALRTLIPGEKIGKHLRVRLKLETNGKYKLETFEGYSLKKDSQNDIFFFRYPSGTFILEFQKGINSDELLENMKDGTVLGKINFVSGTNRESFYIYIKERCLVSKSVDDEPRIYTLVRYWNNYYQSER